MGETAIAIRENSIESSDLAWANISFSAASPEAAIRKPLEELVEATIAAATHSDDTRRAYRQGIGLFFSYLDQRKGDMLPPRLAGWRPFAYTIQEESQGQGKGKRAYWAKRWKFNGCAAILRLVDAAFLDEFRAWLAQEGSAISTVNNRAAAVRTLLSVAYRDHMLTSEQAQAMKIEAYESRLEHDQQPVGRRLSAAEVRSLRGAVSPWTRKGKRDLALLDVMLYAGLRREETASLDLSNFHQQGGRWWLILQGKRHKTRRIKVHDVLYKSLAIWCEAASLKLPGAGPIFLPINKGDHIGEGAINASVIARLVGEYGAAAGLAPASGKDVLSAHDLRRTCARNAYDNHAPLLLIQAMLGHSDPKTTAHYIGAFEDDNNTAVDFVRY